MKANIFAPPEPCIGFWNKTAPRANAAINSLIRPIRSRSYWPPRPISCGAGTSPNCAVPPSGPTSTSTSSSTSSAATSSAGWWRRARGAELASKLIEETCEKQNILPGPAHHPRRPRLFHAQQARGASAGRSQHHQDPQPPYTSNDNPYSESQFRTMKYRPEFPDRFGSIQDSRAFCQTFFPWYNDEHRHSGIGMMTPAMVHYGLAPRSAKTVNSFSTLPSRLTLIASSADRQSRHRFPRRSGSTNHKTQTTILTNLHLGVSQSR